MFYNMFIWLYGDYWWLPVYLKGFLHESKRTSLQWTINLRSLRNFLELRQSPKAHFEIRHLSELIKKCLEEETAYKKYLM